MFFFKLRFPHLLASVFEEFGALPLGVISDPYNFKMSEVLVSGSSLTSKGIVTLSR